MRKDHIPKNILYKFISALNDSDSETLGVTEMKF